MKQNNSIIKYPIGVQNFKEIRDGGYVYVDKTRLIYQLISEGKYYFLSRPRRFGKSLLLSAIEAYFSGQRDLFEGLEISSLTDEWESYPIFHLDLNNRNYKDPDSLEAELNAHLEKWESIYGNEKRDREVEERFAYLIRRAYELTGKNVVILIDEYDKPLLNTLGDEKLSENYRNTLKAFYGNLKTMDQYIKFAMMTGVARFSKVSIFSDLNNLRDISFEVRYSEICGITDAELESTFGAGLNALSEKLGMDYAAVRELLRRRYDGYHFSEDSAGIYNPFSLLNVFAKNSAGSYWFESGTPSYLVRLIKNRGMRLSRLSNCRIKDKTLSMAGISSPDPVPVLYQAGYLTIKGFDPLFRQYILDYPNEEVKEGFLEFLLPYYINSTESSSEFDISEFVNDVYSGNIDDFIVRLSSLVTKVPYSEKNAAPESHFQNIIYLVFTLMGFYAKIEERTSDGRIDLVVETKDYVYIFEFKIKSSSEEAIKQIKDKKYWLPFSKSGKAIILIGANFDPVVKRLSDYLIEKI